mmetsp:Transcript_76882/g.212450  ORF Transcript_76882/g.212450 Transcript_76882/m.212450 type:complete len:242 (+) Transcript_76882:683-1408(+)
MATRRLAVAAVQQAVQREGLAVCAAKASREMPQPGVPEAVDVPARAARTLEAVCGHLGAWRAAETAGTSCQVLRRIAVVLHRQRFAVASLHEASSQGHDLRHGRGVAAATPALVGDADLSQAVSSHKSRLQVVLLGNVPPADVPQGYRRQGVGLAAVRLTEEVPPLGHQARGWVGRGVVHLAQLATTGAVGQLPPGSPPLLRVRAGAVAPLAKQPRGQLHTWRLLRVVGEHSHASLDQLPV